MVEITMQLPDKLAQKIRPMSPWLPAVLELSMVGFKTPAAQTAAEIIQFLSAGPSPAEVVNHHVSDRAQERVRRLLALNAGGASSEEEQAELDEVEQIEHVMILLKARAQEEIIEAN